MQVNKSDFLAAIKNGTHVYAKKPNSWKRTHVWLETDKDDSNWFINIADDKRIKGEGMVIEDSVWVNMNRIDHWIRDWVRNEYEFWIYE